MQGDNYVPINLLKEVCVVEHISKQQQLPNIMLLNITAAVSGAVASPPSRPPPQEPRRDPQALKNGRS
ncbi:hypothetical protein VTK26DRAFT_2764 [Humicola hyalothermophila]